MRNTQSPRRSTKRSHKTKTDKNRSPSPSTSTSASSFVSSVSRPLPFLSYVFTLVAVEAELKEVRADAALGRQFELDGPAAVPRLEAHMSDPNPALDDPTPDEGTISTPPTPPPNGTFSRVLNPRFAPISGPRSIFRPGADADEAAVPFKPLLVLLLVLVPFAPAPPFVPSWIPSPTPGPCPQFSLSELEPSLGSSATACPCPCLIPWPFAFVTEVVLMPLSDEPFGVRPRPTPAASSSPSTNWAMTFSTQSRARAPHAQVVKVELRACRMDVICARRWVRWWVLLRGLSKRVVFKGTGWIRIRGVTEGWKTRTYDGIKNGPVGNK